MNDFLLLGKRLSIIHLILCVIGLLFSIILETIFWLELYFYICFALLFGIAAILIVSRDFKSGAKSIRIRQSSLWTKIVFCINLILCLSIEIYAHLNNINLFDKHSPLRSINSLFAFSFLSVFSSGLIVTYSGEINYCNENKIAN